jgi:hypothetical protein
MNQAAERKETLVQDLGEARRAVIELARSLPGDRQYQVFLGVWSPADLIAHLIGWDYTNMVAIAQIQSGELPAFYAHRDRDWKTYNAYLVERYSSDKFEELLHKAAISLQELIHLLEQLPGESYNKDHGVRVGSYKVTIERLMKAELKDEKLHLQQLTEFANETSAPARV